MLPHFNHHNSHNTHTHTHTHACVRTEWISLTWWKSCVKSAEAWSSTRSSTSLSFAHALNTVSINFQRIYTFFFKKTTSFFFFPSKFLLFFNISHSAELRQQNYEILPLQSQNTIVCKLPSTLSESFFSPFLSFYFFYFIFNSDNIPSFSFCQNSKRL